MFSAITAVTVLTVCCHCAGAIERYFRTLRYKRHRKERGLVAKDNCLARRRQRLHNVRWRLCHLSVKFCYPMLFLWTIVPIVQDAQCQVDTYSLVVIGKYYMHAPGMAHCGSSFTVPHLQSPIVLSMLSRARGGLLSEILSTCIHELLSQHSLCCGQ